MKKLHVDSVIKSYGTNQILTDIFISCELGEIVGLLGRNGSGKSTLMKIIFGSIDSERKFVKVDGLIVNNVSDTRGLINYLPQIDFLPSHLTVKTVIKLYCDKNQALKVSEYPIIKAILKNKCSSISGGEKRLLEILIVSYSPAKYILLDEPFNGIAPLYKDKVKEVIAQQSKEKAFIITDHDYRNVLEIASRIVLLHDGGTKPISNKNELAQYGYLPDLF